MNDKNQPTNQYTVQELLTKLAQADASTKKKSNFLATMSHEIRTPMQSVYGYLELIEQEKPNATISSMVQTAKDSAAGMLEILDDILDFAKMDADQMVLDEFEVPVRTLVRGINEALAVKIQGKPITLHDDIKDDVPFVITGDPKRLRQIIMNLMGNAMKFTHEGQVTIRVSNTKPAEKESDQHILRFEIIDTGIGMDQSVADTLFTPFTQADNSTSRHYGGTGLGLSISKKLVEMMGGSIHVTSKKGVGSTFYFDIPATAVSTEVDQSNLPDLNGMSILSVEDHPQGAKEITRSLQSMGAQVEHCTTYAEGLALLTQRPFDIAIIDQGLPDGLGLDLIREASKIRPNIGYIMYTVRSDAGLQHTLQSLGVKYLTKPASRIGLGDTVIEASLKQKNINTTGPKKILIAEDTDPVRDVLRRQLDHIGIEYTLCINGAQAWEEWQTGNYGLLLTDLHMPAMDGYELIQKIRDQEKEKKTYARFPVVVVTADIHLTQRQVYMGHGFDECLLKPITKGQLEKLLLRWGMIDHIDAPAPIADTAKMSENNGNPAIDKESLIALMGNINDDTIDMLGMFVDMTRPLIDDLQTAFDAQNTNQLKEMAHSLKGAARSAAANQLGDYANQLQRACEENQPITNDFITQITHEFTRVEQEIRNKLK